MKYVYSRLSSLLLSIIILICFGACDRAEASKTALIYHSNYYDSHTNVKTQLEADGYTVTLSTTGTIDDNLINSYDVVYDMKYNNSIGSNGKTRYQNFVQAGGVLVLVGENNGSYSNNNQTIEAFIENKLGGTVSINGNTTGCSFNCTNNTNSNTITTTNTAVTDSDYGSNVAVYPYGAHFTGDGTWVAKDGDGRILWMRWSGDQLPSGYTGAAYITFDINQFQSEFDKAKMANLISDTYESILTVTPTSGITSSQTTEFNTFRNKSVNGNQIYITQTGDNNTLNIVQDGDDNLIIGTDLTSAAVINGDNNALDLDQIGNDNVLGLDIVGSSNNVAVTQNQDQRAKLSITGSSNNVDLDQSAINYVGEHYMSVIIAGNSNAVDVDQTETGNKKLFLDIDGSNNVAVDQKGTGNHYAEITLTDSHNVDVTQDGSGDHNATINLSGNPSTVDLTQDSSTSQNYHLQQSCVTNTCSVTVTQN
jgi:hypothetical protein